MTMSYLINIDKDRSIRRKEKHKQIDGKKKGKQWHTFFEMHIETIYNSIDVSMNW